MQKSLSANPYSPGHPIRDPDKFFGREESLNWLAARLESHTTLVAHGLPRIGVTSLLLQACRQFSGRCQTTYLPVESQMPFTAVQELVRVVSAGVGLPSTDSPQVLRQALDDSIYDTQCKPLLIALDGLAAWELHAKIELLNTLGTLVANVPQVHFLLGWGLLEDDTILKDMPLRLIGMSESLTPVAQLRIGALTRIHASQLMQETAQGLLKYDYGALERVWQEANGRPYILQMIGFAIYERRMASGRVSARDVQLAVDDAIARLVPEMSAQWENLTREEQLTLAAAASVRGEHGFLTFKTVVKELTENGFRITEDEAQLAVATLARLDIVEPAGLNGFRFSSGLMRDWAVQYANLSVLTGKQRRSMLYTGLNWSSRIGVMLARALSWTLLLAFFVFLLMGGVSLVQGIAPAPTSTPTPAVSPTPTRTPIPLPTPTPVPNNIIAYMFRKTDKDKWRIYVAGLDGANPRPLTNGLADDQWPSWSPDGFKIAFSSNRDGNWEIYAMASEGFDQIRLTRSGLHDWSPVWSFDGAKIAFSSFRDRNWEIYTMNADGGNPLRLTNEPTEDHAPAWSPDGRVLAFASKRTGNYEIHLMNPDGSAVTRLTNTTANNFSPAWSPDGRKIVFESNRDGNWEIYVMDGDGSNVRNLTNSPANDQSPAWSPDGNWIAFQSNRGGATDIWVMRSDGGDPRNWTNGAGNAQFPAWRPLPKR